MRRIFPILIFTLLWSIPQSSITQTADELSREFELLIYTDPNSALEISKAQLQKSIPNSIDEVNALINNGQALYYMDSYDEALGKLTKAAEIGDQIKHRLGVANAKYHTGEIAMLRGQHGRAIEQFIGSMDIFTELRDSVGIALCLNSIGSVYTSQGNYEQAHKYLNNALIYCDEPTKADSYTYLAQLYSRMEAWDEAKKYAELGIMQGEQFQDNYVISKCLDVLGDLSAHHHNPLEALSFCKKSLKIKLEIQDIQGQCVTMIEMSNLYSQIDSFEISKKMLWKAFNLSTRIGAKEEIKTSSLELAKIKAADGRFDSAFYYQNIFIEINEQIRTEHTQKKMAEMEAKVENEKKEREILLLEQERNFEKSRSWIVFIASVLIIIIILIAGSIVYKRYLEKKRANQLLEEKNEQITFQNKVIEQKSHDILDSIMYARRIQRAILPPDDYIKNYLDQYFIVYLPKDIVAGDFYWLESKNDLILFAAADCTGHGVPGAMVSVICNNGLNRSVREFGITDPSKILEKTRDIVIEGFEKSKEDIKDGMDISLCAYNPITKRLDWSGANNPLWIVRNGSNEVEILKPDKQPIGKYVSSASFNQQTTSLGTGDMIYMFTDGYADQFGGPKNKKYKSLRFKEFISSNASKSMAIQRDELVRNFNEWKADNEQIDDVCIIGFRVS
jgi:serine phosphatase RsbU (regulator of sigma subunit)